MKCPWNELLSILPQRLQATVDRLGKENLQELRMRLNQGPQLITANGDYWLDGNVTGEEISVILNVASKYSPWSATTAAKGYITACGGHRIGICGETVCTQDGMKGIRRPTSLCIRVAREFIGLAGSAAEITGNILILGPPGSGKTTLLRDLIRSKSEMGSGSIAVVDERDELFPSGERGYFFSPGRKTDILSGCPKAIGVDTALRTMGPSVIAVDEITAAEDCDAMMRAGWCGVSVIATAHAASVTDLKTRPVYRPIVESGLFTTALVLRKDKHWRKERIV